MSAEHEESSVELIVGQIAAESFTELFDYYGCIATAITDRAPGLTGAPTALIDSGSNDVEINLAIKAPYSVLAMSYPVPTEELDQISDADLEDWLSELANQLIGRIKQSLVKRGHYIDIGLPEAFYGGEWTSFGADPSQELAYIFSIDGEDCEIHVSTKLFNEHFTLEDEDSCAEEVQDAGELEFF